MGLQKSPLHTFVLRSVSLTRKYSAAASLVIVLFVFSVGTAWSYVYDDGYTDLNSVSHETNLNPKRSSSAVVDMCTPLLNTLHHTPSTLPTVRTQRSVGKIAALGMMLGARYALEPKSQDDVSVINVDAILAQHVKTSRKPALHSAQTIVAYRTCLKNQALAQIALAE
tara:strand:- start:2361 stop:2864 length:504 start_codon:yes stop_codon:yes gene_type:complete